MDELALELDATDWHSYSAGWNTERIRFFVDDRLVRTVHQRIDYQLQLMVGLFEFPEGAERDPRGLPEGRRGEGRARLPAMRVLVALAAILVAFAADAARAENRRPLSVHVRVGSVVRRIPDSFLGLSVEVSELPTYARTSRAFDRALSLLRPDSRRPMPLRVGGRSADQAYWDVPPVNAPRSVFEVDDAWIRELAALSRRDRFRVTLALNLAVHSPAMATGFALAVRAALGPGSLAGLAIGNEPDLFRHEPGLEQERIAITLPSTPLTWTRSYGASDYRRDYRAYARALTEALPGVPLAGPEATNVKADWLRALSGLGALGPGTLTFHRYQFSSCWPPDSPAYPRLAGLVGERATGGLAHRLRRAIRFAHRARMRFVVSEINSMSCGGTPGVADSFATALWAPDALFELARAGVDGVDWHIRPRTFNAPLQVLGTTIRPQPELYGLVLFARMLAIGTRLLRTRVAAPRAVRLKAWAVRSARHEGVLMINKGPRAVRVLVAGLGALHRPRIERLTAPSLGAPDHVRLGGRRIGDDGRWHGRAVRARLRRHGVPALRIPGYSAALVFD